MDFSEKLQRVDGMHLKWILLEPLVTYWLHNTKNKVIVCINNEIINPVNQRLWCSPLPVMNTFSSTQGNLSKCTQYLMSDVHTKKWMTAELERVPILLGKHLSFLDVLPESLSKIIEKKGGIILFSVKTNYSHTVAERFK